MIQNSQANAIIARRHYWAGILHQLSRGAYRHARIELFNHRYEREDTIMADEHEPDLRTSFLALATIHAERRITALEAQLQTMGVEPPPLPFPDKQETTNAR